MTAQIVPLDAQRVLNQATRCLARTNGTARHGFGQYADPLDPRARLCEPWRFPIIDTYRDASLSDAGAGLNRVTFVHPHREGLASLGVIGTFGNLWQPVPLARVPFAGEDSAYWAVSIAVPKGQVHRYKFVLDGQVQLDPINPQQDVTVEGELWSRFFTDLCAEPLVLTRSERFLLERLTNHILPFRTAEGERFLQYFYNALDRQARDAQLSHAYRLDEPVGVVNFIDKLLAREESHHRIDYTICLAQLDAILRRRTPGVDPARMSKENFIELYDQLASNQVPGWNYEAYREPAYFLKVLRRHTYSGAFSHPRHGGNVGAAAWAYLEESLRGAAGESCFEWRRALEAPLGTSATYNG